MTEFERFLRANMAAQNAIRAQILSYNDSTEYGRRPLAMLQTDLLALTVEVNIRYMQELGRA